MLIPIGFACDSGAQHLLPFLFGERVPLLKWTTQKNGYPYSSLSTGRHRQNSSLPPYLPPFFPGILYFQETMKNQVKQIRFLKRTIQNNRESTPRDICLGVLMGFWKEWEGVP